VGAATDGNVQIAGAPARTNLSPSMLTDVITGDISGFPPVSA
jgi:hypothetical protein